MSEELAYLAGFLDGEGSIGMYKATRANMKEGFTYVPHVVVYNTNRESIERFQRVFGIGSVNSRSRPGEKTCYQWDVSNRSVIPVLKALRPYLTVKSRQADLVIEAAEISGTRRGHGMETRYREAGGYFAPERLNKIYAELKELNRRGMPICSIEQSSAVHRRPVVRVRAHRRRT